MYYISKIWFSSFCLLYGKVAKWQKLPTHEDWFGVTFAEHRMTIRVRYGNVGCQVFKGGIQNQIDFWPNINILQGNYCTLWIRYTLFNEHFLADFWIFLNKSWFLYILLTTKTINVTTLLFDSLGAECFVFLLKSG